MTPNTYTIIDSDVFRDTPNLQPDWIPTFVNELNLLERLTYTSSTATASLVDSIDVLYNYKSILSFTGEAAFFNSRYNRLDPSTSLHKSILVQANNVKAQVFHYDSCRNGCTDTTQKIYVPSSGDELQIVIDTGANKSITPLPGDFIGEVKQSCLQSLKQVNGTTPVCGDENVVWDIEDFYGTCRSVTTASFFVPSSTICLFSPQVYIGTHDTEKMMLDRSGFQVTLKCGSVLHFRINLSNNLSFMLTQNFTYNLQTALLHKK